jgi:hypothetical protein
MKEAEILGWGAITSVNGNAYMTGSVGMHTSSVLARLTIKTGYSDGNTGGFVLIVLMLQMLIT